MIIYFYKHIHKIRIREIILYIDKIESQNFLENI